MLCLTAPEGRATARDAGAAAAALATTPTYAHPAERVNPFPTLGDVFSN